MISIGVTWWVTDKETERELSGEESVKRGV